MQKSQTTQIAIIGAGPAGLTAARYAAQTGAQVTLIEANAVAGRKLLITGGGRCNICPDLSLRDLIAAYDEGARFLRYALHEFPPHCQLGFLHQLGIETVTEEETKIFPATHRAIDIRNLLVESVQAAGVECLWSHKVRAIRKRDYDFLIQTGKREIQARKLILATGGLSYPETGSTGEGFQWARILGHDVIPPRPALIPLITHPDFPRGLAGLTIDDISIQVEIKRKKHSTSGPLVFTDRGIGGPAVLNISRYLTDDLPNQDNPILISIDLMPGLGATSLREQWLNQCQAHPRKSVAGLLSHFIPKRLAAALVKHHDIADDLWASNLPKEQRTRLLAGLKSMIVPVVATEPIQQATITRGGVSLKQIDPKTMESKVCPGLYVTGELLDTDGPCGGYNLQICWSTGAVAGVAAAAAIRTRNQ